MKSDDSWKEKSLWVGIAAVLVIFALYFQLTGIRFVIAVILAFILPVYMILRNFGFSSGELVLFSFMVGVGIVPSLVYLLGFILGSLMISLVVVFVIGVGVGLGLSYKKK